jgi:hypothetical protein
MPAARVLEEIAFLISAVRSSTAAAPFFSPEGGDSIGLRFRAVVCVYPLAHSSKLSMNAISESNWINRIPLIAPGRLKCLDRMVPLEMPANICWRLSPLTRLAAGIRSHSGFNACTSASVCSAARLGRFELLIICTWNDRSTS